MGRPQGSAVYRVRVLNRDGTAASVSDATPPLDVQQGIPGGLLTSVVALLVTLAVLIPATLSAGPAARARRLRVASDRRAEQAIASHSIASQPRWQLARCQR